MGPQSSVEVALWGLIIAVIGHAVVMFFKTPKEQNQELSTRISTLESWAAAMRETVAATFARHDTVINHLAEQLEHFAESMDNMTNRLNDWLEQKNGFGDRGRTRDRKDY